MLVVDAYTLQPIDLLNLVQQEVGNSSTPWIARMLCGSGTVRETSPPVSTPSPSARRLLARGIGYSPASAPRPYGRCACACSSLLTLPYSTMPRTSAIHHRVLGVARFEQFDDARQTACDVALFRRGDRDAREHIARISVAAGSPMASPPAGSRASPPRSRLTGLALGPWTTTAGCRSRRAGSAAPVGDDTADRAGRLRRRRFSDRCAVDQVLVTDGAVDLRQDRAGMRDPTRSGAGRA